MCVTTTSSPAVVPILKVMTYIWFLHCDPHCIWRSACAYPLSGGPHCSVWAFLQPDGLLVVDWLTAGGQREPNMQITCHRENTAGWQLKDGEAIVHMEPLICTYSAMKTLSIEYHMSLTCISCITQQIYTYVHSPWYVGSLYRNESVNGTFPNLQGWEVRQEIVANKEAHKDPIINGSLQRREIQNTAEISLACYTTANDYVLLMSRQSWLVSGGSKQCSQI